MQCPYKGLSNQGATCYMNSYLQYLYMTRQFRGMLFSLNLKPDLKEREQDSIPYQLQKLFGKMNLQINKIISTKELTKSFQWNENEAFYEHDINEFGKLLFEAIKISLNKNQINLNIFNNFISKIEGQSETQIKCLVCSNIKKKQEKFTELNLLINNQFTQQRFKNFKSSLLQNLKPLLLNQDNKVFCEKCDQKQDHESRFEILEFPEILTININRFEYDMLTYERKKIDFLFEFPIQFNRQDFEGQYEDINTKNAVSQNDVESLDIKSDFSSKKKIISENQILKEKKGKKFKNIKTSSKTKNFLNQIRKNKKKLKQEFQVEVLVKDNDQQEQLSEDLNELKNNKLQLENTYSVDINSNQQSSTKKQSKEKKILSQQNNIILQDDIDKIPFPQTLPETKSQKNPKEEFINENLTIQSSEIFIENEDDISRYKTHYTLHTVFIHKGSAFSGHYYAYIKSFENHKWYLFDDNHVKEVQIGDVLKDAFGGNSSQSSAYMLVYHKLSLDVENNNNPDEFKKSFQHQRKMSSSQKNIKTIQNEEIDEQINFQFLYSNTNCPEYLRQIIAQERKSEEKKTKIKTRNVVKKLATHKVFCKLEVKVLKVPIDFKFQKFFDLCLQKFDLNEEEIKNCRLRLYNKIKDEMLDVFDDKLDLTLRELKLIASKSFILEIKKPEEEFEEFDINQIQLKLVFWDQRVNQLDFIVQQEKLKIQKKALIQDLILEIKNNFNEQIQKLGYSEENQQINVVNKKILKNGLIKGENLKQFPNKTMSESYLNNHSVLYIDIGEQCLWEQFFESENNKIIIQINYPAQENYNSDSRIEYGFKIKVDLNERLKDFKNDIKQKFNISDQEDFIMKKGGVSGIELKDFTKPIRTLGIINNSFIYLQFGQSISLHEIKVSVYLCLSNISQNIFSLEREIVFLKEITINPQIYVQQFLNEISNQLPPLYQFLIKSSQYGQIQNQIQKSQQNEQQQNLIKDNYNQEYSIYTQELDQYDRRYQLFKQSQQFLEFNKNTNQDILNSDFTRLREKNGLILQKSFKNQISLKHQGCVDRKKIIIELFKQPLMNDQILVYFTVLDTQKFQFTPCNEMIINKRANLIELGQAAIQNGLTIPLDKIEATKIRDVREFMIEDILEHRFYLLNENQIIGTAPFYLESDGCLFMQYKKFQKQR